MLQIWILGFILNIFLFYSVFDIHFKSPLVQVPQTHQGNVYSGIKRVVILVGDGLRADSFFDLPQLHPYLSSVMESSNVAWGISDTRVPTESRPGHIALFAGFYEDPSAVFTGWKENMVEFDSVLNRSSFGIALGSPDVVNMFRRGVRENKLLIESYPPDWQDFLAANSSVLDTWVLEKFQSLIQARRIPNQDKVLIFLHLLGIDNTGHARKPHSVEYNSNIQVVDSIVEIVEGQVEQYFNDKDTLFVFTADHGMTDWGSHGSGSKAETETPFVIWGPGIKRVKEGRLKQADVAALMAGALNIPYPTNSVGRFPTSFWTSKSFAFDALHANFLQIHSLMLAKKENVVANRRFSLTPFDKEDEIFVRLNESNALAHSLQYDDAIKALHSAIDVSLAGMYYYERYDQDLLIFLAVTTSLLWMVLILSLILLTTHGPGFGLWGLRQHRGRRGFNYAQRKFWVLAAVLSPVITKGLIGWPLWRLPYTFLPLYLARIIWATWMDGEMETRKRKGTTSGGRGRNGWNLNFPVKSLLILIVLCGLGTEILVHSFHDRAVLTFGLILNAVWSMKGKTTQLLRRWISNSNIGSINSSSSRGSKGRSSNFSSKSSSSTWKNFLWLFSLTVLALFPIAPVIGKKQNPFFMTLGPLVSGVMAFVLLRRLPKTSLRQRDRLILASQTGLLFSVVILIHFPTWIMTRILAWFSVIFSFLGPTLTSSSNLIIRLLSIFLGICTPFSLLSMSYESLFLPSLFLVLLILMKLEMSDETREEEEGEKQQQEREENEPLSWDKFLTCSFSSQNLHSIDDDDDGGDFGCDAESSQRRLQTSFRRAWFHLFFVFFSFFGTGNIGSVSSFDPTSVRCFVSIFNPFVMMIALLEKIVGPFLLVSCFFRMLLSWSSSRSIGGRVQVERNFLIVLFLSQGMALHTFFMVRSTGSWLEIGTSISHYVIVQCTTLFLFLLHFSSNFLISTSILPSHVHGLVVIPPRTTNATNTTYMKMKTTITGTGSRTTTPDAVRIQKAK